MSKSDLTSLTPEQLARQTYEPASALLERMRAERANVSKPTTARKTNHRRTTGT